jgi:hypothetical protein
VARCRPGKAESSSAAEAPWLVGPADGEATRALSAAIEQEPRVIGISAQIVNEATKAV